MQNIIKGFLNIFGRGKGKVSPAARVNIESNSSKEPPRKQSEDGILDMDICFEVGYKCVRRVTNDLMLALRRKSEQEKPTHSFETYTKWNIRIEDMLVNDISKHYPKHKFITRNKHKKPVDVSLTDEPTWFIDPIHGTINFMHGFPYSVVNLAFWLDKQPRFGIIWNPLLDHCYTARCGFGAYMNVNPLQVSKRTELSDALVMNELGPNVSFNPEELRYMRTLTCNAHGLRSLGCTTMNMCMVAQGFADAYFDFNCSSWDMSAATLLVKEAGGVVLDPSLKPLDIMSRRVLCASTPKLAEQLSWLLTSNDRAPKIIQTKQKPRTVDKADKVPAKPRNALQRSESNKNGIMSRSVLCASSMELTENLSSQATKSDPSPKSDETKKPMGPPAKTEKVSDKPRKEETPLKSISSNNQINKDSSQGRTDVTKSVKSTATSKKPSIQSIPKDELMKPAKKALVTPNDSSIRSYPPFPISMKFSGHPKKIAKSSKKSVCKHPTDPNFPGQGSQF